MKDGISANEFRQMQKDGRLVISRDRIMPGKLIPGMNKIIQEQKFQKPKIPKQKNSSENEFLKMELLKYLKKNYEVVKEEVVFNKIMDTNRRFRADYFIPKEKIIVELNGGQFIQGRHNRGGKGYEDDLRKGNMAQINGFKYYQFTYQMLKRGEYKQIL